MKPTLDKVYKPSDDVVAREIEGEIILVPLVSGMGDLEDELFTLNATGMAVWKLLDGKRSLKAVAALLAKQYKAKPAVVEKDVAELAAELLERKMLVEVKGRK
ncbi:MAG TPA: PqqD family protein [Candidatus Edwardsbacteria bacterium]|nr:PqqD family protein [Candidatus Edwardsbacteria bacterium]